jgi:hypothetical protein
MITFNFVNRMMCFHKNAFNHYTYVESKFLELSDDKLFVSICENKIRVSSSQFVAFIVSSYTTTIVRELNDDSYSLYLDDLATDLYNSFHRSLYYLSSVIIVYLDSSHVRNVVIM